MYVGTGMKSATCYVLIQFISYFVLLKNIMISNVLMFAHSCQKDFE